MNITYQWKKKVFSDSFKVFSDDAQIARLKNKAFSNTALGEVGGKHYNFKTKGFFKQRTVVIDENADSQVGEINYSHWKSKAEVKLHGKTYTVKYNNFFNTKWSVENTEGKQIQYSVKGLAKGRIDSETDDPLLLLTGLQTHNYFQQVTMVIIVAVFVPIWASASGG